MAVEISGEQPLAGGDAFRLIHPVEAEAAPRLLRTFDDKGRALGREAVGVRPDPAVLGLLEREGESVEHFRRAKPHELVPSNVDIDAEGIGPRIAEARISAVRRYHEVVVAPLRI